MEKKDYLKYLKILELGPGASPAEIKNSYRHLKQLYSQKSDENLPLFEELTEQKKQEILAGIEEAFQKLTETPLPQEGKTSKKKKKSGSARGEKIISPDRQPFDFFVSREIGALLKAEGLVKRFNRRTVVKSVSLEVRSGEVIALLGRNGAGKTTTFLMMVGLLRPDGGKILLDKDDILKYSTNRRAGIGITYLPQESSVFLKTSAENNLKMILENKGYNRRRRNQMAAEILSELGLSALARQSAHSLSGGERRRLEICRSLVLNPRFLLLDEPFTGIDPITIAEIQKIILQLKRRGIGIILSDHNVRDALKIADRAYIIDEGEMLVQGSPGEVANNPEARKRFLGQNFRLGGEVEKISPPRINDSPEFRREKRKKRKNTVPEE